MTVATVGAAVTIFNRDPGNKDMLVTATRILVAGLALWLWTADNTLAKPITLAYNTNSLNVTLPIQVAQELGFFTGEGFEVTPVYVRSGPTALTALVSG